MKCGAINKAIENSPCKDVIIPGENKKEDNKYIDSEQVNHFLKNAYEYSYIYWVFFKMLKET